MANHRLSLLSCLSIAVALAAAGASTAAGATLHEFDPVLSLTGGCGTSTVDPVPDPPTDECEAGVHPPTPFSVPKSVATDSYGNIYVASFGSGEPEGVNGRIDVFDSKGFFITEIKDSRGPRNLMVDTEGNLYVFDFGASFAEIMRYEPAAGYDPAAGKIEYKTPPVLAAKTGGAPLVGLGINVTNNHLFANLGTHINEYGSKLEANKVIDEKIGEGVIFNGHGIGLAIDAAHNRIYASDNRKVRVFELEPSHKLLMTIEKSAIPGEEELSNFLSIAADEGTGHFFIFNGNGPNVVYEFDEEGKYVETIEHKFQDTFGNEITVDNGKHSPNGAENPFEGRYLYVPSHPTGTGHSFAFGPPAECPAKIEAASAAGITETEAELRAKINPCGLETTYRIEYTTKGAFEAEGFSGATVAKAGMLPAGASPIEVAASLKGLESGAAYVFGVFAENAKGSAEAEREFATYSAAAGAEPCPNDAFRIGPSELLPDCRAYELVTPPDTNGRNPLGVGHLGTYFATLGASPDGNAATFEIEGGTIPGFEGTGSYAGDPYAVHRTAAGWQTEYAGPTPAESPQLLPGSNSPDQGYSFWSTANGEGSAAVEEKVTTYVRYPDGHSELVGRGSLADDPRAQGNLIAANGSHIIFTSGSTGAPPIQLEENAPPSGTKTIYDRTPDEVTHVVSLLPEDETPAAGENAFYEGASFDGKAVVFRFGPSTLPTSSLYFRYDNEETYEIASAGSTFAGFAKEDKRAFYVEDGDLFAYEIGGTENPIAFSSTGDVTPVNVAPDGNVAYFVSPSILGEENPNGATAQAGKENLYRSEEGQISFVATVTKADVEGQGEKIHVGLGTWTAVVGPGNFGRSTSRTTPDGQVLLFESEAPLTGYDSQGHHEIYRYDLVGNELDCLSCNPTKAPPIGDASLQSISQEQGAPEPGSFFVLMNNLRADGRRAIFQSPDSLALDDVDGLQDVYEWEAQGVGSCKEAGGCVYLISSGHSRSVDYLWAVSDSGNDVFFRSGDLLTGSDKDETPSIYDARVGGGFAEPVEEEPCQGEGCFPSPTPPPASPNLASKGIGPSGNPNQELTKHCPKGKRKAHRHGKTVCVKKHKKHKKHHQAASKKRKGASK